MSEDIEVAAWPKAKPRAKASRFDQISIALHWLTVALVATQLALGWASSHGGDEIPALLTAHRSLGVSIWIIVTARLMWRHGFAHLPPFPASMPKPQQRLATLNEYALYGLLLLQPLTGLGSALFRGRPFTLFAWKVPVLVSRHEAMFHVLRSIHTFGAWGLVALIGVHAAAALLHALILRDGVFQRMLPWTWP